VAIPATKALIRTAMRAMRVSSDRWRESSRRLHHRSSRALDQPPRTRDQIWPLSTLAALPLQWLEVLDPLYHVIAKTFKINRGVNRPSVVHAFLCTTVGVSELYPAALRLDQFLPCRLLGVRVELRQYLLIGLIQHAVSRIKLLLGTAVQFERAAWRATDIRRRGAALPDAESPSAMA